MDGGLYSNPVGTTGGFCQVCCTLPGWAGTHGVVLSAVDMAHGVTSRLIPDSPGWDSLTHSMSTCMEPDPNLAPIQLSSTCTASLLSLVIRDHSPIPEDGRNHSDLWVPYPGLVIRLDSRAGTIRELRAWERDNCRLQSLVLGALAFLHPHGVHKQRCTTPPGPVFFQPYLVSVAMLLIFWQHVPVLLMTWNGVRTEAQTRPSCSSLGDHNRP